MSVGLGVRVGVHGGDCVGLDIGVVVVEGFGRLTTS